MGSKLHIVAGLLAVLVCTPYFLPEPRSPEKIQELPPHLQLWHKRGKTVDIHGHKIFYIYQRCSNTKLIDPPTFILLHGYPSSSFEYHKVLDGLLRYGNVFLHDHVGFGFSDKPKNNYTFSIGEGAENALALWRKVGLKRGHIIAHDMGDTMLTEILSRRHRELLPDYFKEFFESVTFSNGGMKYSIISFRIGQILSRNIYVGPYFVKLANKLKIGRLFFEKQLASIWASDRDVASRDEDITSMADLYQFRGGFSLLHQHMYYIWDRAHFEFRWFDALANLNIPCRFIWGDSDAVAPIGIPKFFSFVPDMKLIVLEGSGHFLMLEEPSRWTEEVVKVLSL